MTTSRYLTFFKSTLICIVLFLFSCKDESKQRKTHTFTNDLAAETSPYLLQHAHNPVNWKPWSPELLEVAQKENKLVIISIGYSSCHWCHVMERETFEDIEVAKLMNENFISIKVDREERPDIDQVYQTAAVLTGNNGGWPLNAITLPNGKPVYLGTYLANAQWKELLTNINKWYLDDPAKANEVADQLAKGINETNVFEPSSDFEKLTPQVLESSVENWKKDWDLELGGNQGQEKFPTPNALDFLLDYAVLTNDQDALQHVKNTLDKMAHGGIYDHLGGGFYRYSTDPQWRVPHFEKMLYDNAQMIGLYSKAYKIFKEPIYKDIVFGTIAFLNQEMKNADGGYYAALDADSEGEEGKFYIWKAAELQTILGDDYALFSRYYNIEKNNVWENENYILYKNGSDETFLKTNGISNKKLVQNKKRWNETLMKVRAARIRPNTDDKVLTSWNALLISGFVEAYTAFGEKEFLNQAVSIYNFIQDKSYTEGQLKHSFKAGSKRIEGFLEDYSFLSQAAIQLYKVSLNTSYLDFANTLTEKTQEDFLDANSGLYRFNNNENLISNIIKTHDGDIPSPNSVMANNLFELGHINYKVDYLKQSKTMLTTLLPDVTKYSFSYANWNRLLLKVSHPFYEIVVVGDKAQSKLKEIQSKYLPNTLIIGSTSENDLPLFEDRFFEDETYIYVCQNSTCKLPVKSVEEAMVQLKNF